MWNPTRLLVPATLSCAALAVVLSCADPASLAVDPLAAGASGPAFSAGGTAACPTSADVVVSDEAGLLAALAAAVPGDVIGIDGQIEVTATVEIATPDLTLTCATPGSGIVTNLPLLRMVNSVADRLVFDHLLLDGSTSVIPFQTSGGDGIRFTNNAVECGSSICAFFPNSPAAVVVDNYFDADPVPFSSAVQFQGSYDGARFERNTMVAGTPGDASAPPFFFKGLAFFGASEDVTVAYNAITGPFHTAVVLNGGRDSRFESNQVDGPLFYGFWMETAATNAVRSNMISGAGTAGLAVGIQFGRSCDNVFVGNNLNGNAEDVGAIFGELSGANVLVGNANVVIDNGDFDCDGDGMADANLIDGSGAVLNGVNLGEVVSDAVSPFCPEDGGMCLEVH